MIRPALASWTAFAVLAAGCQPPAKPVAPVAKASAKTPAKALVRPAVGTTRIVADGRAVEVSGQLRIFLGDDPPAVISNDSGNIISDAGGNIVSDLGGSLIQRARLVDGTGQLIQRARLVDAGGQLIQRGRYQLAAAPAQSALADARIELLDAAGRLLTDRDGNPLGATSDRVGKYKFRAPLPDQVAILRVRLFLGSAPDRQTGALYAMLPRPEGDAAARDLDMASSLGARLVLESFIGGDQQVLDRLPAENIAGLDGALDGARGTLSEENVAYGDAGLLAGAQDLAERTPAVKTEVERIRAILLAGQARLGDGRRATEVALAQPLGVAGDGQGGYWISEGVSGRIRRLDRAGTITVRATPGGRDMLAPTALVPAADGGLYVADALAGVVRRVASDGSSAVVAGGGLAAVGAGGPATSARLEYPNCLALATDGTLYIGEAPSARRTAGRVLRLTPDGRLDVVAPPPEHGASPAIAGLATDAAGNLYVLDHRGQSLQRRDAAGTWHMIDARVDAGRRSRLAVGPDGAVYVALSGAHQIKRYGPGAMEIVAGTGRPGYAADGVAALAADLNEPSGMWFGADGTLVFAEAGNGLIRALDPASSARPIRTLAGTFGARQVGGVSGVSLSSPFGVAIGPEGLIAISEASGHSIKQLRGAALLPIVGSARGPAADDVAGTAATFNVPTGIAYDGPILYVLDAENNCLRKVDAAGRVTIVAGAGFGAAKPTAAISAVMPARQVLMPRPVGLAIGPDHMPYFSDNETHRVWRVRPDGMAEVVAGLNSSRVGGFGGDGGPSVDAPLTFPAGLAFGPDGDLYVCETGSGTVRRIKGLATATPTIETVAGVGLIEMLARRVRQAAGEGTQADGPLAKSSALYGPSAIAFDASGAMYLAELGTAEFYALAPEYIEGGTQVGPRIRKVAPDGTIETVAGEGSAIMADPEGDDLLVSPTGLVVDRDGSLVIADGGSNQIWRLPPAR